MRPHHLLCGQHAFKLQNAAQNQPNFKTDQWNYSAWDIKAAIKVKKNFPDLIILSVFEDGRGGVKKAKDELPWNAELVLTVECWVTVGMDTEVERDWLREEEEEDTPALREGGEGWTCLACEQGMEEGKKLVGPWTKSSQSCEKTVLGAEDEGWTRAWVEKPKVEEEGGARKEAGASKGPWKSLNSSLSSHKAGGRGWVETEGCDGDESAKMKK